MSDATGGVTLVLRHLAETGAAVALLAIWIGTGALVRRRLTGVSGGEVPGPMAAAARWLIDAGLGAGALATLMLLLASVGLLRRPLVLGTALLGAVPAALWLARELPGVRAAFRTVSSDRIRLIATVGLGVLLLAMLVIAVAPPTDWDSLMYHLRIPLQLLDSGRLAVPRDSLHVALVGAAHFAALPLVAAGLLSAPAVLQALVFALVLLGTAALARDAGASRGWSWLAAAVVAGCPVFFLTAVTARVDATLVLALLGAHLALLRAGQGREPRWVYVAALLLGVAVAIKPLAGAFALALIPAGWSAAGGWRRALAAAGIAVAVAAPWYLKNWLLVGAPLYPVGAARQFEPWLADVFGTAVYPSGLDASILRALPESRASFNVLDAFLDPGRLTIETEGRFYRLSPLLALAPLVVLLWRSRPVATRVGLVGAIYLALVVIPFGQINLRYLMPGLPALAVAAAAAVEWLATRIRARSIVRAGAVAAAAVALVPLWPPLAHRMGGHEVFPRHALGLMSARDVRLWHPDAGTRGYTTVVEEVRRRVAPGGRVLLLWESRALPLGGDAIADVMLSNWSFLAQSPAPASCLAGTGITHVLVNRGALDHYLRRGAKRDAFRLDQLDAFAAHCARERLDLGSSFELLVLAPAP